MNSKLKSKEDIFIDWMYDFKCMFRKKMFGYELIGLFDILSDYDSYDELDDLYKGYLVDEFYIKEYEDLRRIFDVVCGLNKELLV